MVVGLSPTVRFVPTDNSLAVAQSFSSLDHCYLQAPPQSCVLPPSCHATASCPGRRVQVVHVGPKGLPGRSSRLRSLQGQGSGRRRRALSSKPDAHRSPTRRSKLQALRAYANNSRLCDPSRPVQESTLQSTARHGLHQAPQGRSQRRQSLPLSQVSSASTAILADAPRSPGPWQLLRQRWREPQWIDALPEQRACRREASTKSAQRRYFAGQDLGSILAI